jgi:hypothetical protein
MATKITKKTNKKVTKKTIKKVATKKPIKSPFKDWQFEICPDSNYPDNLNVSFIKPNNAAWVKEDNKTMKPLINKLMLDPEPIMDGMYSFDGLTVEMIRRELLADGLTEYVEVNTYVPDFSEPVEPPDPNDPNAAASCGGACGSGCGGSCSGNTP